MRRFRGCVVASIASLSASCANGAISIAAGPVYNPANGHRYYRLAGGDWNSLRAFAVSMGGDLATIDDAAENAWVRANVVGNTKAFIGLNDALAEGTLVWADGSASAYRNWRAGEPANTTIKDYANFDGSPEGTWTIVAVDFSGDGIVELAGPILVPAEQATIALAIAAQPLAGTSQILVAPGTYSLPATIPVPAITLRGSGRGQTIIYAPVNDYAFSVSGGSVVQDFTVVSRDVKPCILATAGTNRVRRIECTALFGASSGGLLEISLDGAATVLLESCDFHSASFALKLRSGTVYATNSIFRDLNAFSFDTLSNTSLVASNCVLVRVGPTKLFDAQMQASFENSIFYQITGSTNGSNLTVRNSAVPGNLAIGSNFSTDPRLVNPAGNDFRLLPDSPCIDRGYVGAYMGCLPQDFVDFAGNPRAVDDPAHPNFYMGLQPIDLGAFEFVPSPPTQCPGDLNHDAMVDDADFQIFLAGYNALLCP